MLKCLRSFMLPSLVRQLFTTNEDRFVITRSIEQDDRAKIKSQEWEAEVPFLYEFIAFDLMNILKCRISSLILMSNFHRRLCEEAFWKVDPSPSASDSDNLLVIGWSYKRNKKIWKCSDSYDSVFVKLMTALMTPVVDFHKLVTPLTTATLLHVKRALDYC